jgi:hypothetical protein
VAELLRAQIREPLAEAADAEAIAARPRSAPADHQSRVRPRLGLLS